MNFIKKNVLALFVAGTVFSPVFAACNADTTQVNNTTIQPDANNAGLQLPTGFSALVVASNIGQARHIVVNKEGELYVKLDGDVKGKGILLLQDKNNDGKAETITGFGDYGGTGMAIKNGYLYASSDNDVYRYKLDADGNVSDKSNPERIVTGLINRHHHSSKSITLDNDGNIYVNIGAPSNICAERGNDKVGQMPCPLLDSTGGIWKFKADQLNQSYGNGVHYATGLRNVVGLDWNNVDNASVCNATWPR